MVFEANFATTAEMFVNCTLRTAFSDTRISNPRSSCRIWQPLLYMQVQKMLVYYHIKYRPKMKNSIFLQSVTILRQLLPCTKRLNKSSWDIYRGTEHQQCIQIKVLEGVQATMLVKVIKKAMVNNNSKIWYLITIPIFGINEKIKGRDLLVNTINISHL